MAQPCRYRVVHFYERHRPFYELCNLIAAAFRDASGVAWASAEHYFQATKYGAYPAVAELVRLLPPGRGVFDFSRALFHELRLRAPSEWDTGLRQRAMYNALAGKFTHDLACNGVLRAVYLDDPSTPYLVEHTANDSTWADGGDGSGHNLLGDILAKLRNETGALPVAYRPPAPPCAPVSLEQFEFGRDLFALRPLVLRFFGTLVGSSACDRFQCGAAGCGLVGNSVGLCPRHRCRGCNAVPPAGATTLFCAACAATTPDTGRCTRCLCTAPDTDRTLCFVCGLGLCTKCEKKTSTPGHKWCADCYTAQKQAWAQAALFQPQVAPKACRTQGCGNQANYGFPLCGACHNARSGDPQPRPGVCTKCGKNQPTPGHKWCADCFTAQNQATARAALVRPQVVPPVLCKKCNKRTANSGYDLCGECNKARLAHANVPKKCVKCLTKDANAGFDLCGDCNRARQLPRGFVPVGATPGDFVPVGTTPGGFVPVGATRFGSVGANLRVRRGPARPDRACLEAGCRLPALPGQALCAGCRTARLDALWRAARARGPGWAGFA